MRRYIITGASGHIGNNLVRFINKTEPDAKIVALTRRQVLTELENTDCEQVIGDINNAEFLENVIQKDDIVIHLACLIDLTDKRGAESYLINYLSTKLICDICLKKLVAKFIYVGSVDGIFREQNCSIISEPNDYFPEKIKGNYGKTKAMAMKYVLSEIRKNSSFNAAMLIPSAVIGINDYKPSAVGKVIFDTLSGKHEFGIKGGYNFVNVTDVCKAIYFLSKSNLRDQYIISGENISVETLYEEINRIKGLSKKPTIIPSAVVWLFLPFIKVLNKITLKSLSEPHNYSYERAASEFSYEPLSIDETLKETIEWFEDYYNIG